MSMVSLVLATLLGGASADTAGARDVYVAMNGNDAWSGALAAPNTDRTDGPFATLEGARDEIRKRKAASTLPKGLVTVHIRGGSYPRDRVFELTPLDSGAEQTPIVYRAYQSEQVNLVGGKPVINFKPVTDPAILERLDESARGHIVQADLKAIGVVDLGDAVAPGQRIELFFKDQPMTLARWPNEGFVRIADVVGGKPIESHGIKGDAIGKFTYEDDRPQRWTRENDVRLHGYWFWDWADGYEKVASLDVEKRVISTVPPYHGYGYRQGARWYALNVLAELDRPGEWYLDRKSSLLYFWPPAAIKTGEAFVSVLDAMITMDNTSHVAIRGLTLAFNRGTAITIRGGTHCVIDACTIKNVGGGAVAISGGTQNGVTGCDIYNIGDNGISLSGGERKTLTPGGHYAVNNHIHHYSRAALTYRTAVNTSGVGNRIAHNLMHDAPHMAIGLSGNEHVIEFNEVHTVCMDTDDAGGLYMGRDWTWRGNVIRYNYFHHVGKFKGGVGVQSVYLDDWASGSTVFGNVFYKAGRGVLVGGGRDNTVENNVFVDCTPAVHVDSRGLGWAKSYFDGRDNTLVERLNAVPYKEPPWSTRYPELLKLYSDEPAVAKGNRVLRNICVGGRWLDLSDGLTDKVVQIADNLVNVDPRFMDAEHQNFQLQDDSPAYKLGFKRIPVEQIGLQKDKGGASDYRWKMVSSNADFAARDGAGALVLDGRMWLLGGWNPGDRAHFPKKCNSEVWFSSDGVAWTLANRGAPWEPRHTAGYAVFKDRLWILGGDPLQGRYQDDVWNSRDGIQWERVAEKVPWAPRVLHYTAVFEDRIWVMGGQTVPQFAPAPQAFYNDVWSSADGARWTRVTEHAPWEPRGMIGGSVVFRGRIWILGGGTYDTPKSPTRRFFNDVWSTADGVHWQRHLEHSPWAPREYHDVAVFDDRMWVLEGWNQSNRNDVWYSADGVNWCELPGTPWEPRHAASLFVHDRALWMVAGNNMASDVWKLVRGK